MGTMPCGLENKIGTSAMPKMRGSPTICQR
jgi:hypothetical protein